ncbi:hypothetical protein [Antarctobacter sp.]|uniref:hypothetical protein n=1 Tax=Antarctobacter sp. TaxID=1872577 RepID=UPI002B2786F7|nr:hypothetical protein [Antarctobacter sp.]
MVLGFAIGTSATAVAWLSDEIAGVFAAIGIMLFFTVLFSWAGHLPGAVMLHYALVRGKGGWAVAMAGGLAIGVALSALIGSVLAALLGPFLALAHLAALRWMASLFRPRGDRIAPSGCGAPQ